VLTGTGPQPSLRLSSVFSHPADSAAVTLPTPAVGLLRQGRRPGALPLQGCARALIISGWHEAAGSLAGPMQHR